ncbi:MAG: transglutaminase domain-containing protein, partial [Deltaproteobacteria bacterium]
PPPSRTTPPPPPTAPPPAPPTSVARQRYLDWLRRPSPHALATNIPASASGSYEQVAQHIASRVRDPYELTKAIHDFIAVRIDYDADFDLNRLPPSDPKTVFDRREAVCAGYARLFKAMMETVGYRAVYISGDARFAQPRNPSASHAWNAVELEGRWYLVDVTWDAGHIDGRDFVEKYRTDYLLAPPDIFVLTHLPQQTQWQLLAQPLSRGAFLRQPLLLPRFFAYGFGLVTPDRSQITVAASAHFEVDNPLGASVFFAYAQRDRPTGPFTDCVSRSQLGRRSAADCQFTRAGDFYVYVFAAPMGVSKHEAVARFEVNSEAPSG